jgi:hypothetical protein
MGTDDDLVLHTVQRVLDEAEALKKKYYDALEGRVA